MTPRYVDAEEAKKNVFGVLHCEYATPEEDMALSAIDDTPTADVEPVIHAHWIEQEESTNASLPNNRRLICSHCRTKFNPVFMSACCGFIVSKFPECPICGARMDEKVR